jgi:hypothetical protein
MTAGCLNRESEKGKPMAHEASGHDYLAIIPIGTGSSWGRASSKETAIANALRSLKDWDVYFDVSEIEVTVNVIDVQGYSTVTWDSRGGHGLNETTGENETINRPIEYVQRSTPKLKRKRTRRA